MAIRNMIPKFIRHLSAIKAHDTWLIGRNNWGDVTRLRVISVLRWFFWTIVCPCVSLSVCLVVCAFVCLCVCLFVCLYICLSSFLCSVSGMDWELVFRLFETPPCRSNRENQLRYINQMKVFVSNHSVEYSNKSLNDIHIFNNFNYSY